jgi:hypothetical protein
MWQPLNRCSVGPTRGASRRRPRKPAISACQRPALANQAQTAAGLNRDRSASAVSPARVSVSAQPGRERSPAVAICTAGIAAGAGPVDCEPVFGRNARVGHRAVVISTAPSLANSRAQGTEVWSLLHFWISCLTGRAGVLPRHLRKFSRYPKYISAAGWLVLRDQPAAGSGQSGIGGPNGLLLGARVRLTALRSVARAAG